MKKAWLLGLLLLILPFAIHAQTQTRTVNEISSFSIQPTEEEFPLWAKDLRRAEIITFGSLPFTMLFSTIAVDTYLMATHDWDIRYAPWPIRGAGAIEMSVDQRILTLGIALGSSILISVADNIIIQVKRSREAEKAAALPAGDPIIIRRPIEDAPLE
jgi:hypothetical protein